MRNTAASKVHRQGDVILIPTTKTPSAQAKRITDQGRVILAYGEQTGHCHEVVTAAPTTGGDPDPVAPCELFEERDGTRILVLTQPAALTHDEHGPAALPAGVNFEVRRQVEWSLDDVRAVAD